uniref:PDDEXK nuclease domain-containing protein n=1 Tax=Prevotella sp. TaxID=59823 RepID=UPI004027E5EF
MDKDNNIIKPIGTLTPDLRKAVDNIKQAILESQLRATKYANSVELSLYYGIGHYISDNSRDGYWGKGAIKTISEQLHKELPGLRGFSSSSLKNMRQFYETWSTTIEGMRGAKSPAVAGDLANALEINTNELLPINRQPVAGEITDFNLVEFLSLSFTHHMEILNKTSDLPSRLFYIHIAIVGKWSKNMLRDALKADLYHHQGQLPNNFAKTVPTSQALKAIQMFKDEYLLDFMNVEELGERDKEDIDERVVEQAIIHNVKNFIMTFGKDFTFVGNQYHLEKFGHELFPDLLFFNRELAALVCVELKRGDFKPSYLGQLSAYLKVLDDTVKKPFENPSIGLILCKSADKTFVEYLIQDYDRPMGAATYKSKEDILKVLPPAEELEKLLDGDDKEE